jgi:hypothetical protein
LGAWTHLKLEVRRDPMANDGSGSVVVTGVVGSGSAPPLPPGSLAATGHPLLGLATTVTGPSGVFETQFDNVTVDFPKN